MVTLSWIGWQMLLIGGSYHRRGIDNRGMEFLEGGLVLLFYSLYLLLRLKRKDVAPTRESAQLFFGAFLAALPGLTFGIWRYLVHVLTPHGEAVRVYGSNIALVYTSVVISVVYALVVIIWLVTNVPAYDHAKVGSLSSRIMRQIEAMVVDPYFKK
ncbi:MAG TPA: hypothetical protein VHC95_00670 [Opitutales bacterium]|nr:hypothetical protein [Opitutales bacterium]